MIKTGREEAGEGKISVADSAAYVCFASLLLKYLFQIYTEHIHIILAKVVFIHLIISIDMLIIQSV